jgi:hypothetical protein
MRKICAKKSALRLASVLAQNDSVAGITALYRQHNLQCAVGAEHEEITLQNMWFSYHAPFLL